MSSFPGATFEDNGVSLNPAIPNLTRDMLAEYPHRFLVARERLAPIARAWLLSDDATFAAISAVIVAEAIKTIRAGKSIVVLARRPEPVADVRDGLLRALDLATVPASEVGRA